MAMNREQKRALQKRGMSDGEGAPIATRERRQAAVTKPTKEARTSPRQYLREIVAELRKTSWPTREETIRLAIIVAIAILVLTLFIFGLDLLFGDLTTRLLNTTDKQTSAAAVGLFTMRIKL
jgi:preprotein translocase subunit SecE